jgi:integrase
MSVTVRPIRQGGWQVDVMTLLPNGARLRDRRQLNIASKSAARRWGEERERHLLQHGKPKPEKEAPTLRAFAQRFIDGHARANRQKPSGIAAREMLLRVHLVPFLGHKRLNAITSEDVQRFKESLVVKAPKTVNNALTVLSVALRKAVEWDVIERMPCRIQLLPVPKTSATFHDFEQYERLVETASALDRQTELIVLLGGDAGLRCGEMIALELARRRSDQTSDVHRTIGLERRGYHDEGWAAPLHPAHVEADGGPTRASAPSRSAGAMRR